MVVPDQLSEVLMNVLQLSVDAEAATAAPRLSVEAFAGKEEVVVRVLGGMSATDSPRRERTRRLVEDMNGRLSEDEPGVIELTLPAAAAVTYRG